MIDNLATGGIDEDRTALHRSEGFGVECALGRGIEPQMQADHIGPWQQGQQCLTRRPVDLIGERMLRRGIARCQNLHAQRLGVVRQPLTDRAETDHEQGLASQRTKRHRSPVAHGLQRTVAQEMAIDRQHRAGNRLCQRLRQHTGAVGHLHLVTVPVRQMVIAGPAELDPFHRRVLKHRAQAVTRKSRPGDRKHNLRICGGQHAGQHLAMGRHLELLPRKPRLQHFQAIGGFRMQDQNRTFGDNGLLLLGHYC